MLFVALCKRSTPQRCTAWICSCTAALVPLPSFQTCTGQPHCHKWRWFWPKPHSGLFTGAFLYCTFVRSPRGKAHLKVLWQKNLYKPKSVADIRWVDEIIYIFLQCVDTAEQCFRGWALKLLHQVDCMFNASVKDAITFQPSCWECTDNRFVWNCLKMVDYLWDCTPRSLQTAPISYLFPLP